MTGFDLEQLKKDYKEIEKKHKLPSFEELNEDFDIEKIEDESDFLLREVRKKIAEKVVSYLRFVELLLNPSNAPIFFFALVKGLNINDKRLIEGIYKKLVAYEIEVIGLDNLYNEEKEIKFILDVYEDWGKIKRNLDELVEKLKKCWDKKSERIDKDYFG